MVLDGEVLAAGGHDGGKLADLVDARNDGEAEIEALEEPGVEACGTVVDDGDVRLARGGGPQPEDGAAGMLDIDERERLVRMGVIEERRHVRLGISIVGAGGGESGGIAGVAAIVVLRAERKKSLHPCFKVGLSCGVGRRPVLQ